MKKLNKESSVALYQQLINEIKESIQSGELKSGDRLMTEGEFSKEYDISRITVRKAIEVLVEEGILIKKQGIGTFVAEKRLTRDGSIFMGFTESCRLDNKVPSSRLLSADLAEATTVDQRNLDLEEGEMVIRIRRLRFCDGAPTVLEDNHFSQKYAFLLGENMDGSLYEILEEHGIFVAEGKRKITICFATKEEAELLNVKENDALLMMKDICTGPTGEVIHSCKSIINPQLYDLTFVSSSARMKWEKI